MILVDANIHIYATNAESDQHAASRDWLDRKLSGPAPVGLPWASLLAFLRIATKSISEPPHLLIAWQQASSWLSSETVWTLQPTKRRAEVLATCSPCLACTAISCRIRTSPHWLMSTARRYARPM